MTHPVTDSPAAVQAPAERRMPAEAELFALVYRQIRSLVGGRERDFDDLVQDSMEQILLAQAAFQGRSKVSTWTYQICYRTVLKRRRWYGRWLRRFTLTHDGELPEASSTELAQRGLAEAGIWERTREEAERATRLWAALQQLSAKKRVVVVLHDLESLPCEEIAEIIEQKLGTVRSRLRDGRRELLTLLMGDPIFEDEGARK
jgi:RNA polymerase sigma-70 factor (ECF subfamily)